MPPSAPERTLLLVDGSSYLYRAFHALPELRNSRGNGLLTGLIGKGRDAISDGAIFCKRLIGQA